MNASCHLQLPLFLILLHVERQSNGNRGSADCRVGAWIHILALPLNFCMTCSSFFTPLNLSFLAGKKESIMVLTL